jgi:RIO kinase 1
VLDEPWFDSFASEGLITDVIRPLKSGKEATVHLCRANRSITGADLLAAKVYRPRDRRSFRSNSAYREGRVILNARDARAVRKKTSYGREVEEALWMHHELETLRSLYPVGADVPLVVAAGEEAILMQYLGDEEAAAPQLRDVRLTRDEAMAGWNRLLENVEIMLAHNVIHGDLSPFNVLWWQGRPWVIDLPQAIDPRTNRNAQSFLARDVENLARYFARLGVPANGSAAANDLWRRFLFAKL